MIAGGVRCALESIQAEKFWLSECLVDEGGQSELCFLYAVEPPSSMQVEVLLLILGDNGIKDIRHEADILRGSVFQVIMEHDMGFC